MKDVSTPGVGPAIGDHGGGDSRRIEHAACREFAASVTHDLNNLLLPVLLLAELTRDDLPTGDALRSNMDKILTAAERSRAYLDRVRDFGRSQDLECQSVALSELVENAVGTLRSALPPTARLQLEIAESDGRMSADANRIATVILELGTNAIEALGGAAGTIEFKASETQIEPGDTDTPAGLAAGRYAKFLIRDDGPGMPSDSVASAFGPFVTSRTDREGRGLGLAIAYGVISSHAGTIILDSTVGEGTRVEFYLPMID